MSLKHLHDYKTVSENKEGIVKVCKSCKRRVTFGKDPKGRVDNRRYLEEHKRNFVQPFGRTGNLYRRIYGNPDPHKFEYKPSHIAKQEAERGWEELKKDTIRPDRKAL